MAALLRHFTHEHPLEVVSYDDAFVCDGCHTVGAGERYHCQNCQFDLHKECAVSPANISSHLHRIDHQLNLVWVKPEDAAAFSGHRPCNVCEEQVNGLYFACPVLLCNFVLHPICSKIPASVRHVTDRQHPLTFQYARESDCKICSHNCTGWRYRCGRCRIDIHLECLVSPPPSSPPANHHDFRSHSIGHLKDRRPLDHQYPSQAAGTSAGIQSSSSSPSLYQYSFNCSQHIPYHKPGSADGSAGTWTGMPYSSSSPSYGNGTSSQQYPKPNNNNHGPHKPDGSGHHVSPGGSQSGSKRKKMYAIVGQILAVVATQVIFGVATSL